MSEQTALVVIDLQNDITKNYREIVENVNAAIAWAGSQGIPVVYIKHEAKANFKPGTRGFAFVPELDVVSENVFVKSKASALSCAPFADYIEKQDLREFYIVGADAAACVKSTCYNMAKVGYTVHVLSDCITSYDKRKIPEMIAYYESKGCLIETMESLRTAGEKAR